MLHTGVDGMNLKFNETDCVLEMYVCTDPSKYSDAYDGYTRLDETLQLNPDNVKRVLKRIDHYAEIIQKLLKDQSYVPSKYIFKTINDGIRQKKREIAKPRFFPDQCIHHALMQVLEESIMKGMYYYNCGSVPGRGDKRIRKAVTKFIRKRPEAWKAC